MKTYRLIFIIATLFLISGCVRLQAPSGSVNFTKQSPAARQAQLAKIQRWTMNGAFSIQQTGKSAEIANYTWDQVNAHDYRITINSALNLYRVVIACQNNAVTLSKNGSQTLSAKTPEKLMQKALGWSLPISELHDWIKGMPASGYYKATYDTYGHLLLLKQNGWSIDYRAYKTVKNDVDLPQMIVLRRSGLFVKIVILHLTE